VQGIIPSFGRAADRKVSIALNGGAAVLVPYDANGHFALPVTLVDGTNQLFIALVSPTDTIAIGTRCDPVKDRLVVLSVAELLGEAIHRIHHNESVSALFRKDGGGARD